MKRLARLAVARPRTLLAVWVAAIAVFGVMGTGVQERLTQSIFILPGTETERATELSAEKFGESVFVPILLEGPPRAINEQGPALVDAILERPNWRVLSPWDSGPGSEGLRPQRDAALVVAAVNGPYEEIFDNTADEAREVVGETISGPVTARVTGMPVIGNSIKNKTYESAKHAERIAIPILFIVLLLVFRAPLAALFPAMIGLATVLASSGVIWLLTHQINIDPLAISLASMMGLALGVDYSLLIVTRFREEIAGGASVPEATMIAMKTAGETVTFAGVALIAAMVVGIVISPGDILVSAAVGVITSTTLSLIGAFLAIPAGLILFGHRLDMFRIGGPPVDPSTRTTDPRWVAGLRAVLRRPGIATLLIAVPLLVLTVPAFALNTGPPDVSQLPEDDPTRVDFERITEVMGPGWAAPFEVLVVSDEGTITAPDTLRSLRRWQRQIANDPNVFSVVGPGNIADRGPDPSQELDEQLADLERGQRGLSRLEEGLVQAQAGVAQIAGAQEQAAGAVGLLEAGNTQAADGTDELVLRLGQVANGAELINDAVGDMAAGGVRFERALDRMEKGTSRLIKGLNFAKESVRLSAVSNASVQALDLKFQADELEPLGVRAADAQEQLEDAVAALDAMGIGKTDPNYQAAYDAVTSAYGFVGGSAVSPSVSGQSLSEEISLAIGRLERASNDIETQTIPELRRLGRELGNAQKGVTRLQDGLQQLGEGAVQLQDGGAQVQDALDRLQEGVVAIGGGTETLGAGLRQLAGGAGQLESGLLSAAPQVDTLYSGLGDGVEGARRLNRETKRAAENSQMEQLEELADSGFLVLAGIEDQPRALRDQAAVVVNLGGGGEAGRILVIPESGPNEEATAELRRTLSAQAAELGEDLGMETAVGGTASALAEYDEATSDRLIWLIIGLALVSFLVLIPIFHSVILSAVAVLLNLVSVGAAFGALELLFQGDNPLLGGPGYVDAVSVSAMYTVIFGLSLDYQVFLISRMREGWEVHGKTKEAITYGLQRTASVVTGAAAIMVAVFVAFALTEVAGTRQFGTGMVVAVIIDATLVRLILLPAVLQIVGDRAWGRKARRGRGVRAPATRPSPRRPADD